MPHSDTPQSACRFAIAEAEITPLAGINHRMWGATTGIHRPLAAKVLIFQLFDRRDDQQIVVSLDHSCSVVSD